MVIESECLGDREGHDGYLPEKFLTKYYYGASYRGYRVEIWLSIHMFLE